MKHVLIVDDALDLGRLLKTTLNLLDPAMPVVVVPSGEEALLEASRYPLDLLVTDVRLPGMSGFELVEKVRVRHPDAKIIIITGLTDDSVLQKVRSSGVDAFFNKPMSIPDFTEAARRCLGMSGAAFVSVEQTSEDAAVKVDLPAILSRLHKTLFAQAVLLIDERGRVVARAGDSLLGNFDASWAPAIQEALTASFRISRLLEETLPHNVIICKGELNHLVLSPVGGYSLIICLDAKLGTARLPQAFEESMKAQQELTHHLEEMGLLLQPGQPAVAVSPIVERPAPESVPEAAPEINLQQFEALFEGTKVESTQTDSSAFWD